MIEQGPALKDKCTSFVVRAFKCLSKMYEREVLEEILGEERLARLETEVKETKREIEKMKIAGRVIERSAVSTSNCGIANGSGSSLRRSVSGSDCLWGIQSCICCVVSGKAAYSYEALQAGRSWPTDVVASRREEHLDIDEFHKVFSISYEAYCAYPSWKRNLIKKEKKLF